jgi:hypothetical protein
MGVPIPIQFAVVPSAQKPDFRLAATPLQAHTTLRFFHLTRSLS